METILTKIQSELVAPKWQRNHFWNYNYRSAEDILNAVKPLLKETNSTLTLSDKIIEVWGRIYIEATATIKSVDFEESVTWFAREPEQQKGMSESQITWTASSYARKYALNWLFAIDDTKDADTNEHEIESKAKQEQKVYGEKKFFNYEDLEATVEAWNTTLEDIQKIVKQDWYTVSANAKKAIAHFINTWEVVKDLFYNKK